MNKILFATVITLAALLTGCPSLPTKEYDQATAMKGKIEKYKLDEYAQEDVDAANKKYEESKALYEKKDNSKSKKSLDETNKMYQDIYDKTMPLATTDKKQATDGNIDEAKSLKAQKKFQKEYDAALAKYEEGKKAEAAKDYEKAYQAYADSIKILEEINAVTKENKQKAETVLNKVKDTKTTLDEKLAEIETIPAGE
jgi:tetratricopeptide (TPR) repeat protein